MQNGIYKSRYKNLAAHLQWQRIEELGQVFLPQKYTFWSVCHFLKWIGQPLTEDIQIVPKYLKIRNEEYLLY